MTETNGPDPVGTRTIETSEPTRVPAIATHGLRKVYSTRGERIVAIDQLDLVVPEGEVFGLIGPNGAGKTTLLKMLATLMPPTFGRIEIFGLDTDTEREAVCPRIGFMPERFAVYEEMKVWEYLEFYASAYGCAKNEIKKTVESIIELTDLTVRRDSFCGSLSKGMRQRLLLAKTLVHDPEVLILDEPTDGMDPQARIEFRNMIRTLAKMGKTIIISSHILADLSVFCTSVGIMESSRLVVSGTVDEVRDSLRLTQQVEAEFLKDGKDPVGVLLDRDGIGNPRIEGGKLIFNYDGSPEAKARALELLVKGGIRVTEYSDKTADLEDILLKVGATEVQ